MLGLSRLDAVVDSHFGAATELADLGIAQTLQGVKQEPVALALGTLR